MGLSASQGRMLSLTSRMSDLEYRAQNIENQKIRLADQSEAVSKNYLDALNAKKLTAYNADTNTQVDATLQSIYTLNGSAKNGKKRVIVDSQGNTVVPSSYKKEEGGTTTYTNINATYTDEDGNSDNYSPKDYTTCPDDKATSTEYLYQQLSCGNWFIVEYDEDGGEDGLGSWDKISWSSGDSQLATVDDDVELAKAEAEYETAMNEIQVKDKRYDLELQTIDTEHSAIQTEIDSVSKVMDKNIERTFKIFG